MLEAQQISNIKTNYILWCDHCKKAVKAKDCKIQEDNQTKNLYFLDAAGHLHKRRILSLLKVVNHNNIKDI